MNTKQIAGERAVDFVEDGMVVGLGTGSTAYYAIKKIGERVQQGLKITGICTSESTRKLAEELNIPYVGVDDVERIDLTIDGADEVDSLGNGIKGGGGALMFEKVVSSISNQVIWVVDKKKLVNPLGAFPLPVEILPYGHKHSLAAMSEMDYNPELRMSGDKPFLTDGGHYIADLHMKFIEDPEGLDRKLNLLTGVVENGLFLQHVNKVVVASAEEVDIITFR